MVAKKRRKKSKKKEKTKAKKATVTKEAVISEKEIVCPNCGAWVSESDLSCPICGHELKGEVLETEAIKKGGEEGVKEAPLDAKHEEKMMKILEWQAQGYDTSHLEALLKEGGKDVDKAFEEYERNVRKLDALMESIMKIEADERLEEDVEEIRSMLNDPRKVDEIEEKVAELEKKIEINSLRDEIYELDTRGFEDEVAEIEALLEKYENTSEVRKKIKELRRKIKARFFEVEIERKFKPEVKPKLRKIKIVVRPGEHVGPLLLKDLFIMHRDGTVLSHLTQRTKDELQKIRLPTLIHYIQTKVRIVGEGVSVAQYNKDNIYINNGNNLAIVLIMRGKRRGELDEITGKALEILERRYGEVLARWSGDASTFQYVDGYANVLMKVLNKMGA